MMVVIALLLTLLSIVIVVVALLSGQRRPGQGHDGAFGPPALCAGRRGARCHAEAAQGPSLIGITTAIT